MKRKTLRRLVSGGVSCLVLCSALIPREARGQLVLDLGALGEGGTATALAVSADGKTVVGMSFSGARGSEAYRWTQADGMKPLGDLPGGETFSVATAVSGDGSVIVGTSRSESGREGEAFRWTAAGGLVALGDIPGGNHWSEATGVSRDGSIVVGYGAYASGMHAFRSAGGLPEDLDDLDAEVNRTSYAFGLSADGSVIVGSSDNRDLEHEAFRLKAGGKMEGLDFLPDSPGSRFSRALAASADGSVVVGWGTSGLSGGAGHEAFRWADGKMKGLGDLAGGRVFSEALAVSDDGSVVLGKGETGRGEEAFIWVLGWPKMRRLQEFLAQDMGVDLNGWTQLSACRGISLNRNLVGDGVRGAWALGSISDRDEDGIYDHWETTGIDFNHDGFIDLDLKALGADPDHKDVFVEIDYMDTAVPGGSFPAGTPAHDHHPDANALSDVERAFQDLGAPGESPPVPNPDGVQGVRLYWIIDDPVPEIDPVLFLSRGPAANDDYDDLKGAFFGTSDDRTAKKPGGAANHLNVLGAKRLVFRYAIFGHDLPAWQSGSSGWAEIGGNDFIVTLGGWSAASIAMGGGQQVVEAGTFMHELGHTLALRHGGADKVNCKPNYLSVMNYALQDLSADPSRPLDYSRSLLDPLIETALDETKGIGGPAGRSVVYGILKSGVVPAPLPKATDRIDWNGDADDTDKDATTPAGDEPDPNFIQLPHPAGGVITIGDPPSPGETLVGHDDWPHLKYSFRFSGEFADGVRGVEAIDGELTAEKSGALALAVDLEGDGIPNGLDNCPRHSNPGQEDLDGDGVGDVCESAAGGVQRPADGNQDGIVDISDGIHLLEFLFLGTVPSLPCGDGTAGDPANASLLDSNGDAGVDISDAAQVFQFLFLGSAPPVLGTGCVEIPGCPDNSSLCRG